MLFKVDSYSSGTEQNELKIHELERSSLCYKDCSKRFYEVSRDFSKQYAHIYAARLNTFRNILGEIVQKKWSNKYKILKLCELREKETACVIIGTLFKHQELKPSILRELSEELDIIPQPSRTHFVHESDSLVLEDELQRIKLSGDCIDVHKVVTGVVCAILGSEDEDGIFTVKDVCWPECNIQKPLAKIEDDRYIVLASGLNMSSQSADHWLSLQLLLEWVSGAAGTATSQAGVANIVRLIVAGGVFTSTGAVGAGAGAAGATAGAGAGAAGAGAWAGAGAAAEAVDAYCAALSQAVPLDLMPGTCDPAGVMLPQKPFHYCLFPKAAEYKSFNRVSNPYECDIGGLVCIGSSGEGIRDILRYSTVQTPLQALALSLRWRHLAPTCPDTVPAAPALTTDPFTMYHCPAIYYCGHTEHFDTDIYEGNEGQRVRMVCVPDFSATKTVALVNLANMDCYSMSFS